MCTNHSMVMAWSRTGPPLRKKYEMTNCPHILGNCDTLGFAGPRATRTINTTPQNSD